MNPRQSDVLEKSEFSSELKDSYTSREVAALLGIATGTVQKMFNEKIFQGWKTAGGHRRISKKSLENWLKERNKDDAERPKGGFLSSQKYDENKLHLFPKRIVLIEDSAHYRNIISNFLKTQIDGIEIDACSDIVSGLIRVGQKSPDLIILDLLLPGIDGMALLSSIESNKVDVRAEFLIITSMSDDELEPYSSVLKNFKIIKKTNLLRDLMTLTCSRTFSPAEA